MWTHINVFIDTTGAAGAAVAARDSVWRKGKHVSSVSELSVLAGRGGCVAGPHSSRPGFTQTGNAVSYRAAVVIGG